MYKKLIHGKSKPQSKNRIHFYVDNFRRAGTLKGEKKTKLVPYTMNKEKFRRVIELHINGKFIDPIVENVVEHVCDLWLKKDFKKHK